MITYDKTLIKKLFGGTSRKSDEKGKKKKKIRMGIAKLFPLNANANVKKKKARMAIAKLFALNANANRFIVRS